MKLPLVGPTYDLNVRKFDAQRCVNLYPHFSESGSSKEPNMLLGTPGLELFATCGIGPIRGLFTTAGNRCFVVSGNKLCELSTTGTVTDHGSINTTIGRVSMAENGSELMVVDGTNGYILTLATDTLTEISHASFPDTCDVVQFQDGYFIVNDNGTGDFYISGLYDGTSWATLDKTTVESSPDNIVSLLSDHGELFIAGERSIEVFYNSGNPDFPFERIGGAIMQAGMPAGTFDTIKSFDNTVVWLGTDDKGRGVVWRTTDAYRPERISTTAVEDSLASASTLEGAYAFVYHQRGHIFYCLQIPVLNVTWVYDGATGMWHERMFYNSTQGQEEQWRAGSHTFFNQFNLVGDRESGKVYKMRLDYYSDNGDEIHRIRRIPVQSAENKQVTWDRLELDMEAGVGLSDPNAQGHDPQVMMRMSKDGGNTWGNELWAGFGKQGEYDTRVFWVALGMARNAVFEFKVTDPVEVAMIGAYAEVTVGMH